jgi:hypothetical protein
MLHDCVVEVVGIAFVLILQFVEEVEEFKCERRRGAEHRCRKPVFTEELNFMWCRVGGTVAVLDDDAMNTVQVEDHVIVEE